RVLAASRQLELDFFDDPDRGTTFPVCDDCSSEKNLHLTISGTRDHFVAKLQCAACRTEPMATVDTSIPMALLTRPALGRLFEMKRLSRKEPNVSRFEQILHAEFESKWETLRMRKRVSQTGLFDPGTAGGLKLTP